MTSTSAPWTVTVAGQERLDGEKPYAYVVNAITGEEATVKVLTYHHGESWDYDKPYTSMLTDDERGFDAFTYLVKAVQPGVPDARYHWTDLRGIPQARVALEPELIREVARLRLAMKRQSIFRDEMNRAEQREGEISPSDWEQWEDMGSGIVEQVDRLLSALGHRVWNDGLRRRGGELDRAAGIENQENQSTRFIANRIARTMASPAAEDVPSTAAHAYGLIEWDSCCPPTLIVGRDVDGVRREALRILSGWLDAGHALTDDEDFPTGHPCPDPDDPGADVSGWLNAFRQATTVPWFTILDSDPTSRDETAVVFAP